MLCWLHKPFIHPAELRLFDYTNAPGTLLSSLEILLKMCSGKQFSFLKGQAAVKWEEAVPLVILMEQLSTLL
ncbi:hypothetical protein EYF80_041263 [Liparis tanakae]|uniref:Uncharacterized protein n=1 Tax=Liparis tanakae TaxID=230148 RepID=A0A4Z2G4R7_9TELE|nr:hypothetical protein EYF80_041263 [Liparis tanakae]